MTRSSLLSTAGLCGALLAYSNIDAWLELRANRLAPARVNLSHLAVLAFVLSWGWAERLSLRELGLQINGMRRSLGYGLAAGLDPRPSPCSSPFPSSHGKRSRIPTSAG